MVVEGKVDVRRLPRTIRVDEAYLVEAHVRLAQIVELLHALLTDQTERQACRRVAEHAYTGRISAYGGEIGSESFERTAHTYVACRTVQVVAQHAGIVIDILGSHGHYSH